jgi:hypothetical protein
LDIQNGGRTRLSWFRTRARQSRTEHRLAFDGFVEKLAEQSRTLVEQANVAATVTVVPESDGIGPFVEVTPAGAESPAFSVFVFDVNNAAVTIGGSTVDWPSDTMLDELKSLLDDRIHGRLSEEVTRNRRGEAQRTTLLRRTDAGVETVWKHYSASAWLHMFSRTRNVEPLLPFPPEVDAPSAKQEEA